MENNPTVNSTPATKQKGLKTSFIIGGIAFSLFCFLLIALFIVPKFTEPKFAIRSPKETTLTVYEPTVRIRFECNGVKSINLKGEPFSDVYTKSLCKEGLKLAVMEGENIFKFEAFDKNGKAFELIVYKVTYNK